MRHVIETDRLRLISLGADVLRASLDDDPNEAERLLGAALPPEWPEMYDVFRMRREQLVQRPADEPWLTRAIELKAARQVVGVTGFHGPPGGAWLRDYAPDGVELGYTVFPAYQRRGLAAEAVTALIVWAQDDHAVGAFVLSISPENRPSAGLAAKLGFRHVGEWTHPIRGLEHVHLLA